MSTADILHDTAMEYYDLGRVAKAKGKEAIYWDYLNKAYILDKEAAIKKYQEVKDPIWKYVYLRSAAWLAIDCKKWEAAAKLARFGLQGSPPPTEKAQFEEILQKVQHHIATQQEEKSKDSRTKSFMGILTAADISNAYIIINGGQENALKISVPVSDLEELVKFFWGSAVEGTSIVMENGELRLIEIQKAA